MPLPVVVKQSTQSDPADPEVVASTTSASLEEKDIDLDEKFIHALTQQITDYTGGLSSKDSQAHKVSDPTTDATGLRDRREVEAKRGRGYGRFESIQVGLDARAENMLRICGLGSYELLQPYSGADRLQVYPLLYSPEYALSCPYAYDTIYP